MNYKSISTNANYELALIKLEVEHVTFQKSPIIHFKIHYQMFCLALKHRKYNEVLGQIPRLLLAIPGSILGLAPKGNVGSTKMGIFESID